MSNRPPVTATLYDNVTVTGTWINTEYSDPMTRYEEYKRIINNVTLAVPHPGKLPLQLGKQKCPA